MRCGRRSRRAARCCTRPAPSCAAPGGKAAHLLERDPSLRLLALDVEPARLRSIAATFARLSVGATAALRQADAGDVGAWWDGRPFDAILLDAPCTASGIVRRHPDVRWLRRPGDVAQLAEQQKRLLTALWPLLRPGGRFVYCTCSVFHAEGQAQIAAFLAHNSTALLGPGPGHLLPGKRAQAGGVPDNQPSDHDGFFYAVLQKSALDAPARQEG